MSFVLNDSQQISLFDSLAFLSERKQRMLDKSCAKPFSDYIFSNIAEMIFAPLYSEKKEFQTQCTGECHCRMPDPERTHGAKGR